jgi:hypothetical protein
MPGANAVMQNASVTPKPVETISGGCHPKGAVLRAYGHYRRRRGNFISLGRRHRSTLGQNGKKTKEQYEGFPIQKMHIQYRICKFNLIFGTFKYFYGVTSTASPKYLILKKSPTFTGLLAAALSPRMSSK